jgi:NADH-quinone oxidoreductase subunit E
MKEQRDSMATNGKLSEELEREIRAESAKMPDPRAACLEALRTVERHHGWVSDDHLREVARLLGMTAEEVESNASYYNHIYRESMGRHTILVCESVSCWIMGYEEILERLLRKLEVDLGGTTSDGRFTVLPIQCLGACDRAPAITIDDDLHCDLTVDKLDAILEKYR